MLKWPGETLDHIMTHPISCHVNANTIHYATLMAVPLPQSLLRPCPLFMWIYQVIWNLTAPDKAMEWTFKGIVTPVKDPYCPPHSKLVQRYTINNGSHMGRRNNSRMSSGNTPAIRTLNVHNIISLTQGGNPVFIE